MRLDQALAARRLSRSRSHGAELVAAGLVSVDGTVVTRASAQVTLDSSVVVASPDPYVSRAAHKLLGALSDSGTQVSGRVLDAGASTGGFTQVCLERGATIVYAVDVGHGQLAGRIAADQRVVVHEGLNLRDLTLDHVGGSPVDLVVADVSFISLRLLLAPLLGVLSGEGIALLLVKPQFEVGRERLGKGGVVRSQTDRVGAVDRISADASRLGWVEDWRGTSRLPGLNGNAEIFLRLRHAGTVAQRG